MQQQPRPVTEDQQSSRIMQILGLLLILSGLGAFVLGGIFSPQGYSQLTLGDNTTQASGGSNVWTDIAFDQTLTLSRYWRRDTGLTTFLSLSNGGVFDLYIAVAVSPPTCNVFIRLVRQRGSDPSFYQMGVVETPVKQPNGMSLTVLEGLRTEAGDVYKVQWLSDCPQASLVPVAVDLGLLGVPDKGVQAISSYLIVIPAMSAATLPPPPPSAPTAAPTAAPSGSGIMTINDIGPDPTSLNFQLIPGANVQFDQVGPNSLRINATAGRDGANGTCIPCVNGTQGPQGQQGPQGVPGRDASVTVSVLNLSNNTNVTETVYNATQLNINITITENATFVSTNCSCLHTVNTIGPNAQLDFTLLGGSGIALTPGTNALTIATTAIEKINGVAPDSGNNFALTAVGPLSVAGTAHGAQLSTTCVATIGGVTADSSNNIGLTALSPLVLTNTSHAWQLSTTSIATINNVTPDGSNNFALTAVGPLAVTNTAHGAQLSTTCVATIGGVTADSSNNIGLTVVSPLVLTNTSHAWQLSTTLQQGLVAINSVTADGTNNFLLTGTGHISIGALTHGAQVSSDGTPNNVNSTLVARDSTGSFTTNQITCSFLHSSTGVNVTGGSGVISTTVHSTGTLIVDGTSLFNNDITANSNIVVQGVVTAEASLVVWDLVTAESAVTAESTLDVWDVLTARSDARIDGQLAVGGTLQVNGTSLFNDDVAAKRDVNVDGTLTTEFLHVLSGATIEDTLILNNGLAVTAGAVALPPTNSVPLPGFSVFNTGDFLQGFVDATGAISVPNFASYQYYRINNLVYCTIVSYMNSAYTVNATGPIILAGLFHNGYRVTGDQYIGTMMLTDNGVIKMGRVLALSTSGDVQISNLDGSDFTSTVALGIDGKYNSITAIFPC